MIHSWGAAAVAEWGTLVEQLSVVVAAPVAVVVVAAIAAPDREGRSTFVGQPGESAEWPVAPAAIGWASSTEGTELAAWHLAAVGQRKSG